MNVHFRDVRVGDQVFDPSYNSSWKWRSVTEILSVDYGHRIVLAIGLPPYDGAPDTRTRVTGHPDHLIDIRRDDIEIRYL
jgi:hypothetical protein